MADDKTFIDQFRKNSLEIVKVHLQKFASNENQYVDIRIFLNDEYGDGSGEEKFSGTPTKKGITLHIELLDRLIDALNRTRIALNGGEASIETKPD